MPNKAILDTFNEEWIQGAQAEKLWDKKRDRLQHLVNELEGALSLAEGSYEELLNLCKKYTSDSNLPNRLMAIKALGLITHGVKD